MHGLINRSIENFLRDTYGDVTWHRIANRAGVSGFETMMHYDDAITTRLIEDSSAELRKPAAMVLEDVGAYLVTIEPLRRLLRFGGTDFTDFLMSLDELDGRSRLALSDLDIPHVSTEQQTVGTFSVRVQARQSGWGAVLAGLLRAMADDYGALVLVHDPQAGCLPAAPGADAAAQGPRELCDMILVQMLESRYTSGRMFDLANGGGM